MIWIEDESGTDALLTTRVHRLLRADSNFAGSGDIPTAGATRGRMRRLPCCTRRCSLTPRGALCLKAFRAFTVAS